MAEDVQGLIVLTEGDRFVTIGRAGRARVWRIDLSGEPVDDVDRTGVAAALEDTTVLGGCQNHSPVQHRDGKRPWCDRCGLSAEGIHHDDLPLMADRG